MGALPARRMATSALCAALLVGITGPAALAADSTREHRRASSSDARLRAADVRIAQVRAYNRGELAPVADLLKAVLEADDGRLSAVEARKLGAAAKRALDKAADRAPAPRDAELRVPERRAADLADDEWDELDELVELDDDLDDLLDDELDAEPDEELDDQLDDAEEAVDDLLEAISGDLDDVLSEVDDLLTEVEDLIDELVLLETDSPAVSTLPSTVPSTSPAVTLPAITQVLLPAR
ncbi:hypothetical protein ACFV7R_07675 [Streptomyces sp. NPDC059866]|uniref:hypothetical protein n=1 Tax=Streptomyces sp. NPDC059866 TaxID=3346978 RepID=UPI0036501610